MESTTTNALFTLQSMLTLGGATTATLVVTNGLHLAFGIKPRWLGLLVAQAICIGLVVHFGGKGSDYGIAVINGFLVYCSAAGATAGGAVIGRTDGNVVNGGNPNIPKGPGGAGSAAARPGKRRFFDPWF